MKFFFSWIFSSFLSRFRMLAGKDRALTTLLVKRALQPKDIDVYVFLGSMVITVTRVRGKIGAIWSYESLFAANVDPLASFVGLQLLQVPKFFS